ncbi:MAG: tRNA-binding protein [Pirellulaceae bacterium]
MPLSSWSLARRCGLVALLAIRSDLRCLTNQSPGTTSERVEIRAGTVTAAEVFHEARKPAYKVTVDFGAGIGVKRDAQITAIYSAEQLVGRQVIGVVNFPPKQIGPFRSEFLLAGFYRDDGSVVLAAPISQSATGPSWLEPIFWWSS